MAERVAREAKRRHFAPRVMAMDAYSVTDLPAEARAVFVASTTGQVCKLAMLQATYMVRCPGSTAQKNAATVYMVKY